MYEVIGIERLDYQNKQGNNVRGYRIYFTFDLDEKAVGNRGKACDSVFLGDDAFSNAGIDVGSPAMPIYNKYGRCTGFMEAV